MSYRQGPPNCIQIEPVEGCNLRCSFCGIRGIRAATGDRENLSGPYLFMRLDTATEIARQAAAARWNPRIEIAMHGEPTIHPKLPDLVERVRAHLPRSPILLTTNGLPILDTWDASVRALYRAGVDTIAVDDYRPHRARAAVLGTAIPGVRVHRYPEGGPVGNPHRRPRRGERRLVLIKDISQATEGNHSALSNHAGCAGPPSDDRRNERCALPFRELAVRHDGSIALCCNDWRGRFRLGNVHRTPLSRIWQSDPLQAARRRLYSGRRDFAPCEGCTHRTFRNGLLPDRMGRDSLPAPLTGDDKLLEDAVAGEPLSSVVPRRWELPITPAH